ncbi:MAG: transposase [Candidatus Binatia bacterium]
MLVKPQEAPESMLWPLELMVPPSDTVHPELKIEFSIVPFVGATLTTISPSPAALLLENVVFLTTTLLENPSCVPMSYARMGAKEQELEEEVARLLEQAQQVDAAEDAEYGKGRRGDELPAELAWRESRLRKIREAKAALEAAARAQAEQAAEQARTKLAERARHEAQTGKQMGGRPPQVPDPAHAQPAPTAQHNFTDPDSRIMKDGATKGFEQAYNAQAAVDSTAQIIVAAAVTQAANDKQQLQPLLEKVKENWGRRPEKASADAGYFNSEHLTDEALRRVDLDVPPDRQTHGAAPQTLAAPPAADASVVDQMRQKLKTAAGQAVYKWRKAIVEPVFGQSKEARGFRRFSLRGLPKVAAEWDLITLTHNLLKLWRAQLRPLAA